MLLAGYGLLLISSLCVLGFRMYILFFWTDHVHM